MRTIHHLSLDEVETKLLGKFWEDHNTEDLYLWDIDAFLVWLYEQGFEVVKEENLINAFIPRQKEK